MADGVTLTEEESALLNLSPTYPKLMFRKLVEEVAGSGEELAFAITSTWIEDHFGRVLPPDEALEWLRGECPDDRVAIGRLPDSKALMAVLHPDGRAASEAGLAKVLNKETPNG